jgi:hypothetical protein
MQVASFEEDNMPSLLSSREASHRREIKCATSSGADHKAQEEEVT